MSDLLGTDGKILGGVAVAGAIIFRLLQWIMNTQQPQHTRDDELLKAVKEMASDIKDMRTEIRGVRGTLDRIEQNGSSADRETHQRLENLAIDAARRGGQ